MIFVYETPTLRLKVFWRRPPSLHFSQARFAADPRPAAQEPAAPAKLEATATDLVADPVTRFFSAPQYAALKKLSAILMPASIDAGVPEFLDFLIAESPAERQQTYRAGLDALNAASTAKFAKPFASLDASQCDAILAPLRRNLDRGRPHRSAR